MLRTLMNEATIGNPKKQLNTKRKKTDLKSKYSGAGPARTITGRGEKPRRYRNNKPSCKAGEKPLKITQNHGEGGKGKKGEKKEIRRGGKDQTEKTN